MKFIFKKYNSKSIDNNINNYLINQNNKNKKKFLFSVNRIKKNYLHSKTGFYLLKISKKNINNLKINTQKIGKGFGPLQKQNKKGDKIIVVETKKIKNKNLRYHQTNMEGSIHTDGPQLKYPPKTIMLACERNSKVGGETVLTDAEKIHKFLNNKNKKILKILQKKYFFEKKGFNKSIIKKPIFANSKKTNFRYIKEYIDSGYKLKNKKIPYDQQKAITYLEELIKKTDNVIKCKLKAGDIIIINNQKRAHGRKKFSKTDKAKRKLYRVWIKS